MKKKLIVCADDFALTSGVSAAITQLVEKERISAVSCMSICKNWPLDALLLKPFRGRIGVGIHVTLTHLPPLNPISGAKHPGEVRLLLSTWTRCIDQEQLRREIHLQFERFIQVWGTAPDFIDGHQHVHVLPIVRDIVIACRNRYAPNAWIRNVVDFTHFHERKRQILSILGWRLRQRLKVEHISYNHQIFGFYDYNKPSDFESLMRQWIDAGHQQPALVYCHPGFPDESLAQVDTVLEPRQREFDFLNSDTFGQWLRNKIELVPGPLL